MILDSQTNKVYLAAGLRKYEKACLNLLYELHNNHIHVEYLKYTQSYKHVWSRDYMPIQLQKDRFLLYKYKPDYLQGYKDYIPRYKAIAKNLGLNLIVTDIILDGGNIVKCKDKVIMTDKIFKENPKYQKHKLIEKLEKLIEVQIVIIPWDRYDMFGHADGMVRHITGNRVLLNNYSDIDTALRKRLLQALTPHFIVEELEYDTPRCSKQVWAYINFLQTNSCIFAPGLNIKEDSLALAQIQHYYPDFKVLQIRGCEELVRDGGALNCITWNILSDIPEWKEEVVY